MRQMDTHEVIEQMESEDIVRDIILIHPEFPAIGFEDDECRWYIAGLLEIIPQNVPIYQKIFNKYLGDLKKDCNIPVIPGKTVPIEFIQYLNIMNGFLLGGRAIRNGVITLEQAIDACVQQQGGCLDPPINLLNNQAFYGNISENSKKVEIARICPHANEIFVTIEYMLYLKN